MPTRQAGGRRAAVCLLGVVALAGIAGACRTFPSLPIPTRRAARLEAILVNGGGQREANYQSHLLHVKQLLAVLGAAGVSASRITVFGADGSDPAPDLAVRDRQPEDDFWLLRGTRVERSLRTQVRYENSTIADVTLRPATRAALDEWFRAAAGRLGRGDTLLVYVTDHGTKNPEDQNDNFITLWGQRESLSVRNLAALLDHLDPATRVVTLMSQCYSGAFANLMTGGAPDGVPRGTVCGFFSSTADRPAYGCYPENRDKDNVGHSFRFIEALAAGNAFPAAHAHTLVNDRTPDVPLKTSDVYLERVVHTAARARGVSPPVLIDELLTVAWRDKGAWEPEIRLLDRIGQAFGYFSPRSVAELTDQAKLLPEIDQQLRSYGSAWKAAQYDLAAVTLERFLVARPPWAARVHDSAVAALDDAGRRDLTGALLAALATHVGDGDGTRARLLFLKDRAESAGAAQYRMQVRLGVVLRMQAVLSSIAGRVLVADGAHDPERSAYAALGACEDLTLSRRSTPVPLPVEREPFPSYDDELRLTEAVLPAWMGIRFRQASPAERTRTSLADGAAAVLTVYPGSPADKARLSAGDIVLGPPGHPFTEPHQIREWVMTSPVGAPASIDVLRDVHVRRVTLVPERYPLTWPALPGPPKIGSVAPKLPKLAAYRGTVPAGLGRGEPALLFFWATWCAPCKASLPEVLAFGRERGVPVIAITDERAEQLDLFFSAFREPFPSIVAMDDYRQAFLAFGVSGTPAFALVDGAGHVASYAVGYRPDVGIELTGWTWAGRPSPRSHD